MKIGDKVKTHLGETGTISRTSSDNVYDWWVLIDGDKGEFEEPYREVELTKLNYV